MLYPTIDELTQGKYNRYELALATARCARLITEEYVRQHDAAEKSITGNKETDKPLNTMIDRELRDEKAVRVAIGRIYEGAYVIDPLARLKEEEDAARRAAELAEKEARAAEEAAEEAFADEDEDEEEDEEEDAGETDAVENAEEEETEEVSDAE